MTREIWLVAAFVAAPLLAAQETKAPISSQPIVELRGRIEKVEVARGQGAPSIDVLTEKGTSRVVLGSMRYLVQQDFNPKAGTPVYVKGYEMNEQVVAIRVELPEQKKTLLLRDEQGRPLWTGGWHGKGPQHNAEQKK